MAGEKLVMISRNIDDACSLARLTKQFLNDVVMLLRPINATTQRPDIDQIANDIECVELILFQECEKSGGIAPSSPEMNVGNPGGTITIRAVANHGFFVAKAVRTGKKSIVTFARLKTGKMSLAA